MPRKSLENCIKHRVVHGTLPGPSHILDNDEEAALIAYIKYMAKGGFPMTRKIVCMPAKKNGKESRFNSVTGPGMHWWCNFCSRHPELTLRISDKLDCGRARNANKYIINNYFDLLEKTLEENNIKDKGCCICNCDETGIELDSTKGRVLAAKGSKHVYSQSMGTREHITVHACACADGSMLPPMIIFTKGFPGGAYTRGGPTMLNLTLATWMVSFTYLGSKKSF